MTTTIESKGTLVINTVDGQTTSHNIQVSKKAIKVKSGLGNHESARYKTSFQVDTKLKRLEINALHNNTGSYTVYNLDHVIAWSVNWDE